MERLNMNISIHYCKQIVNNIQMLMKYEYYEQSINDIAIV